MDYSHIVHRFIYNDHLQTKVAWYNGLKETTLFTTQLISIE